MRAFTSIFKVSKGEAQSATDCLSDSALMFQNALEWSCEWPKVHTEIEKMATFSLPLRFGPQQWKNSGSLIHVTYVSILTFNEGGEKKSHFQTLFFKSLTSAACIEVMKKPCSIISPRLVFENGLQPIAAPLYKDDKRLLLASAGFLQRSLLMDVFLQIWASTALKHLWDACLSQSPCLDVLRTSDLMLILSGRLVCDSPALQDQISFLICFIFFIPKLMYEDNRKYISYWI